MDPKQTVKKMKLMSDLFAFAFTLKKTQLKNKYPELSDKELNFKTYLLIEKGSK